jgi:hypothetical protein
VGLGLSVSRQLARLMGGDLVYRGDDRGSVFELTVPTHPIEVETEIVDASLGVTTESAPRHGVTVAD